MHYQTIRFSKAGKQTQHSNVVATSGEQVISILKIKETDG
jgi:hypothetical protein